MLKRNPLIAAIMLGLVIGGIAWATVFIAKYYLFSPIDKMSMDELSADATAYQRVEFTPFMADTVQLEGSPDVGIVENFEISNANNFGFETVKNNEAIYDIQAKTSSALDPFRDEILKARLLDLIDLKNSLEFERTEFVRKIHDSYLLYVGTSLYRMQVYDALASYAIISGMENPRGYPVRQSELKSGFYEGLRDEAGAVLDDGNRIFARDYAEGLELLKQTQNMEKNDLIFTIRDYVLEKTSAIEQESNGSNGEISG